MGGEWASPLATRCQAVWRCGQSAARLSCSHQADIELGEAARFGGERGSERAAGTHLVAQIAENSPSPGIAGVFVNETQRAIEILARRQHARQLAGDLAERGLVETAAVTALDLQEVGP